MLYPPIIPIEYADKNLIFALIISGVLEETDEGIKCKENSPAPHRPK